MRHDTENPQAGIPARFGLSSSAPSRGGPTGRNVDDQYVLYTMRTPIEEPYPASLAVILSKQNWNKQLHSCRRTALNVMSEGMSVGDRCATYYAVPERNRKIVGRRTTG